MLKGKFITFEGIDGCGKTTQINLLNNYLQNKNHKTILTLEPGGCDIGKELRKILLFHEGFVDDTCELLLYLADRSQHVSTVILKSMNEGKTVLCDRYTDSTVAYQGYARKGDIEKINFLNDIATKSLKPDLTLLFDLDTQIAQNRLTSSKDRLEKEKLDFHNRVREGYLSLAKIYPERIKVIDASLSVEKVFEQVKKYTDEIL